MVTNEEQAARLREIADDLRTDQKHYAAEAKKRGEGKNDFERGCAVAFGAAADRLEGEISEVLYA